MKYYTFCCSLALVLLCVFGTLCQAVPISIDCTRNSDPEVQDTATCLLSVGDTIYLLECTDTKLPAEIKKSNNQKIDILAVDFSNCNIVAKEKITKDIEKTPISPLSIFPFTPLPPELFNSIPDDEKAPPQKEKKKPFEVTI